MNISAFEQQLMNAPAIDLSTMARAEPIKTTEERRAEWLKERRGKFTASDFYRLMGYENKPEFPKGAMTYVQEKVVETLTEMDEADRYISMEMQWGIDHELEAVAAFSERTGLSVDNIGDKQIFVTLGDHIGGTPDGLIGNHSGIEIKCPKSVTHFEYSMIRCAAELKAQQLKYYWQVMGSIFVTGRDTWYFASYDPRFFDPKKRLHYIEIERDEAAIDLLQERLGLAIMHKKKLLEEFG